MGGAILKPAPRLRYDGVIKRKRMKFNGNSERKAYWTALFETKSAQEMEEALSRMPPDTSRVLQLHYCMKYPLKDIAKIMNRSRSTVQNHLSRGVVRLYKYFNPDWWKV